MKITRDLILKNFEEKDIKEIVFSIEKLQRTLNYYIKNKPELYIQYINLMNENEKNLIFKGELSDELIQYNLKNKTNNDKEFIREDGTKILDTWQTTFKLMILKIATEFDTIVDLNRYEIFNLKYNPKATSIKTKNDKPISDPDFILNVSKFSDKTEQEQYFLELKSYIAKDLKDVNDKLIFKEWQFNNFKGYHDQGKKIIILHKYYLNDNEVLYRFFDFEETFKQGKYWFETDMQYKNKGKYYQMVFTYLKPFKEFYQDLDYNDGLVKNMNGKYISLNKKKYDYVFCK